MKLSRLFAVSATCALALSFTATAASGAPVASPAARWHHPGHGGMPASPSFPWRGRPGSGSGSLGTATVGSTPVGNGPSELAIDPDTHTIYVANGNNNNGPPVGGDTVSVIDTRRCRAQDLLHCRGPWPTITVGNLPSSIAVDEATDTVYVTNAGDNTLSVFNGATCDAMNTSGCGRTPVAVPVGMGPLGIYADDANDTLYVANLDFGNGSTVSMIDLATCNAFSLATCPTTEPPTVNVATSPLAVTVDDALHTVYVSSYSEITVFDASMCNAVVQLGCGTVGTIPSDSFGNAPNDLELDTANNTAYGADFDNTISVWNLSDCDASNLAGCSTLPYATLSPFAPSPSPSALYVAVDVPAHSVYVTYEWDDSVAAVDTDICNGTHLASCATLQPPLARTGAEPQGVVLDPQSQTMYVANELDNDVSVIDASRCDARVTGGCRQDPTAAPVGWGDFTATGLAPDPAVDTLYAVTQDNAVAMLDTRTCNSHGSSRCAATPPQVTVGTLPDAVAVDPLTHTVYVASFGNVAGPGPSSVSMIDADTCNATNQAGCRTVQTLQVPGGNASGIAVDAATGTLYVGTLTDDGPDLVSVFNAATCDAVDSTGCGQVPETIAIGDSGGAFGNSVLNLAVDEATNTLYATNIDFLSDTFVSDGLYVIDGATCDAAVVTGCAQTPLLMGLGLSSTSGTGPGTVPWGLAVDGITDTVYVALDAAGDYGGSVAVVNGATCNGSETAGCGQVAPLVPVGFNDFAVAVDAFTHHVYVSSLYDASVSVIDGATCDGVVTFGCTYAPRKLPAAHFPASIVVDPAVGTVYVAALSGISVLPLAP